MSDEQQSGEENSISDEDEILSAAASSSKKTQDKYIKNFVGNALKRPQYDPIFEDESVNATDASDKVAISDRIRDMESVKKVRRYSSDNEIDGTLMVSGGGGAGNCNIDDVTFREFDMMGGVENESVDSPLAVNDIIDNDIGSGLPDLLDNIPALIDAEDEPYHIPTFDDDDEIGLIHEEINGGHHHDDMDITLDNDGLLNLNRIGGDDFLHRSQNSTQENRAILRELLADGDDDSSDHSNSTPNSLSDNSDSLSSSEGMSLSPPMADSGDSNDVIDDSNSDGSNSATDSSGSPDLANALNEIMNKPKTCYSFNLTSQLMRREHGFSGSSCYAMRNGLSNSFNMGFYSSRYVVERMKVAHELRKHSGCVNCLNFSRDGSLLCSGSDDTRIVIWDWAKKRVKHSFKSGHSQNIFQTKFLNSNGTLGVISSSLDGEVRHSMINPAGGKPTITPLYRHEEAVHKIVISPHSPNEIISAGEDGHLLHKDLRTSTDVSQLVYVSNSLYSVSHHPYAPQVCISGNSNVVQVYDKRMFDKALHELYPQHLKQQRCKIITCSVYDSTGDEILASYGDDNIYLFNNKNYVPGEFAHCYKGHLNQQTIKGVNFFGPHSEYIISGSDCGHVFFWDKKTEAILNFLKGDSGVVNCLEPQLSMPILAVSGLDSSVKVITPTSPNHPPDLSRLEAIVRRNLRHNAMGNISRSESQVFNLIMHQLLDRRNFMGYDTEEGPDDSFSWNILPSSSNSSSSSDEDRERPPLAGFQCRTQ